MTQDLQAETLKWMSDNSVKEIFEIITANLMFHKPEDPKAFVIDLLTTMKTQGAKPLLNEGDIQTMFGMFDVTQQGMLTKQQAFNAVRAALGARHPIVTHLGEHDSGDSKTLLNKDGFTAYVQSALKNASPKLES
eukprot:jgi/Ulvmu1/6699/UM030_0030.1